MQLKSLSLQHLVQTLLWCSHDTNSSDFLDKNFTIHDVDKSCLSKLELEFADFIKKSTELIELKLGGECLLLDDFCLRSRPEFPLEHDYILTRNHYGAGFWDGDWDSKVSRILTDVSQALPEIEAYVGDDNLIHF